MTKYRSKIKTYEEKVVKFVLAKPCKNTDMGWSKSNIGKEVLRQSGES